MNRAALPALLLALAALGAGCEGDTTGLGDGGTSTDAALACQDDTQCPADQHCDDTAKICVAGTGNACAADGECAAGQRCEIATCNAARCHGNACVAITTCADHDDCRGHVCTAGTCAPPPPCGPDERCPPGLSCDDPTDTCIPSTSTSTCTGDRDCDVDGEICRSNLCVPGVACSDSMQCPSSERCIRDFCRDPCTSDESCGGMRFRCDTATGECQFRCLGDATCPMGLVCESNLCVDAECTEDADCNSPTRRCAGEERGHGRCEDFVTCDPVNPMCPANSRCEASGECVELPRCVGDRNCGASEFCDDGHCQPAMGCAAMTCPSGFDCVADRCVPGSCRGLSDCPNPGELCLAGVCQMPPPPSFVTEVRILTPSGVVRPGTTYAFVAVALDQAGEVVPGVTFQWTSTSSAVAAIDGRGLATGGARAGTTDITASVVSPGQGTITSPPVRLVNVGALAQGHGRVTVISQATASVLPMAVVTLHPPTGAVRRLITDGRGVADFDAVDEGAPFTVTVTDSAHDVVSVVGSTSRDLVISLPTISRPDRAAGIKGPVDLSAVQGTGALRYSVSGASFPSPLVGTDASALFGGELFTVHLQFGGRNVDVPVPAGSTASVEFLGSPFPVKDTYYARAKSGLRAAWSFGGRLDFNLAGGGGTNPGDILGAALPYFQRFSHDVRPALRVLEIPTITDAMDVDGDGNTTEQVPDWNRFPTVPMRPDVAQSLRVQMVVDNARLPFVQDGNANALIVLSGALLPGVGFVPLGLDGLQDDNGSGLVPSFTTRMAPAHGGLEVGEYAVLALAFRANQGGLPRPGSTRLFTSSSLPMAVDFSDGWIDAPRNASYDIAGATLSLPASTGDVIKLSGRTATQGWEVWAPSGMATRLQLPVVHTGTATGSVTLDAIDLATGVDATRLFDVAQGGALGIDRATRGYARGAVTAR